MKSDNLRRLEQSESLRLLPDGTRGVHVSLQYQPRVTMGSRSDRNAVLVEHFKVLATAILERGGSMDLSSVSTSGQTVEAVLPIAAYDELVAALAKQHVRVDPIVSRAAT